MSAHRAEHTVKMMCHVLSLSRGGYPQDVIHHSDQGSQYTTKAFKDRCQQAGVRISMGSEGDCYDNDMAESFFATLECELLNIVPTFKSFVEADSAVFQFIEEFTTLAVYIVN